MCKCVISKRNNCTFILIHTRISYIIYSADYYIVAVYKSLSRSLFFFKKK